MKDRHWPRQTSMLLTDHERFSCECTHLNDDQSAADNLMVARSSSYFQDVQDACKMREIERLLLLQKERTQRCLKEIARQMVATHCADVLQQSSDHFGRR